MKTKLKNIPTAIAILTVITVAIAGAADDPAIKGKLRSDIQASMKNFIDAHTIGGTYFIFDAAKGQLMRLKFDQLHAGIVKKGDFYVSCADFVDREGRKVDLDFLVVPDGGRMVTTQAVVHAVDGKKRPYHME